MSLLIKIIMQFIRGLFSKKDSEAKHKALLEEVTQEVNKKSITINRATRREMAKALAHHPDHKGITHLDLPKVCSKVEFIWWVNQVEYTAR